MNTEAGQFDVQPFSYDILDEEAAKISRLISEVNKKCAGSQVDEVARDLFNWAEQMSTEGRCAEAEFLYLHAINIWQHHHELTYPIQFVSLRDYAKQLLLASDRKRATECGAGSGVVDLVPVLETNTACETNAA